MTAGVTTEHVPVSQHATDPSLACARPGVATTAASKVAAASPVAPTHAVAHQPALLRVVILSSPRAAPATLPPSIILRVLHRDGACITEAGELRAALWPSKSRTPADWADRRHKRIVDIMFRPQTFGPVYTVRSAHKAHVKEFGAAAALSRRVGLVLGGRHPTPATALRTPRLLSQRPHTHLAL